METAIIIGSGLALGFALGYTLQRGSFCMNTAFRSIIFEKDHSTLRAYLLAVLINLVAVQLLDLFAVITITRAPFFWPALVIGGGLFGVGMVFAGGCTSGTWYRCGKGMIGSLMALIGFALGATLLSVGPLAPLTAWLRRPIIDSYGEELTLYNLLPGDPFVTQWIVTGALMVAGVIWLARAPKPRFVIGWDWRVTGVVVGAIGVGAWYFSSLSQRDYGLSFTQPTVSLIRFVTVGDSGGINWATWMVLAIPFGALAAAIVAKDFALRLPSPQRLMAQFGGGLLMGIGASIAGGCNIGHGITGVSTLALSSITATLFTMAGVWGATWWVYRRAEQSMRLQSVEALS